MNLIDTPGHSDFAYEVSRALNAVEGGILLVDGTKGIQAQTLSNLRGAQKAGLRIIPAVNKIDLALPHIEKVVEATAELLGVEPRRSVPRFGKDGRGREGIARSGGEARAAAEDARRAGAQDNISKALIFDSAYDDHKGIIANVRVFGGEFGTEDMHSWRAPTASRQRKSDIFRRI